MSSPLRPDTSSNSSNRTRPAVQVEQDREGRPCLQAARRDADESSEGIKRPRSRSPAQATEPVLKKARLEIECSEAAIAHAIESGCLASLQAIMSAWTPAPSPQQKAQWLVSAIEWDRPQLVACLAQSGVALGEIPLDENSPPLELACRFARLECAKQLVRAGDSLNPARMTRSLIYTVCEGSDNNLAVMDWLVEQGADCYGADRDGRTALHHACDGNDVDAAKYLVSKGWSPDASDRRGNTPLHLCGHEELACWLLERSAAFDTANDKQLTPFLFACEKGYLTVAKELHRKGALLSAVDKNGANALMLAAYERKPQMLRWLVGAGLDINAVNKHGRSALHFACGEPFRSGIDETATTVRELLSLGADPKLVDTKGKAPLMLAAIFGHVEAFDLLIAHGAELNGRDQRGFSACSHAIRYGWKEVVCKLRQAGVLAVPADLFAAAECFKSLQEMHLAGADLRARDGRGRTLLMAAASAGNVKSARYLLDNGVQINDVDEQHRSALHHLSRRVGAWEVAALLLARAADRSWIDGQDLEGNTPLMLVARKDDFNVLKTLIGAGANLRLLNYARHTALDIAAAGSAYGAVRTLLAAGAQESTMYNLGGANAIVVDDIVIEMLNHRAMWGDQPTPEHGLSDSSILKDPKAWFALLNRTIVSNSLESNALFSWMQQQGFAFFAIRPLTEFLQTLRTIQDPAGQVLARGAHETRALREALGLKPDASELASRRPSAELSRYEPWGTEQ